MCILNGYWHIPNSFMFPQNIELKLWEKKYLFFFGPVFVPMGCGYSTATRTGMWDVKDISDIRSNKLN